jgi:hypothetical protein
MNWKRLNWVNWGQATFIRHCLWLPLAAMMDVGCPQFAQF